jgi:hypothetical protein
MSEKGCHLLKLKSHDMYCNIIIIHRKEYFSCLCTLEKISLSHRYIA